MLNTIAHIIGKRNPVNYLQETRQLRSQALADGYTEVSSTCMDATVRVLAEVSVGYDQDALALRQYALGDGYTEVDFTCFNNRIEELNETLI